ncbi:Rieske 2Fe-2S domain-containing protein [Alphaproteobacteria bacterium]|nr:Rieske 2Fe-2S domain-containing protein [Alphaproteobacteria bacterium]
MGTYENDALNDLVKPDRVHRDFYTNPDVFELEMERIFGRAWLIVGHDSQVPNPGDYITTSLCRKPVIMSRHTDGQVHLIFNRCSHRGAQVCTELIGNAARFECPYHGWVYHTDGSHAGAPYPKRYADGFLMNGDFDLAKVPRMAIYRGFVFGSLSCEGPDLDEFLGPMKLHIDQMVDRAPDGVVEACAGVLRYRFDANWKIQMENQNDLYHPMFTHASTTAEDGTQFRRQGAEEDEAGKVKLLKEKEALNDQWEELSVGGHRYGHTYMGMFPMDKANTGPVYERYKAAMEASYGDRAADAMAVRHHNSIFYPQWSIQYLTQHIRIMNPISVDRTENIIIPLKLKGAPEEMWHAALKSNNNSHSPSGMVMSDDMEVWVRCQDGLTAPGQDWVVFARGLEETGADNSGNYVGRGTSEICARNQHLAWLDYMCGES